MSKIVKNNTGGNISVSDTGVTVNASSQYTIPPQDYLLWAASDNIVTEVGAGNLIINDGSIDLSISDGIDLIKGLFLKHSVIGNTDNTLIGNTGDRLKTDTEISSINLSGGFPCPTIPGNKWRTINDTSDISLSTSSFTQLKQLNNGVLHSFICDLSTDKVDFKVTIDGTDIINVNIYDLEAGQGGSSHGQGGGILCVKTGSKVHFTPPCGLTYSTLTISAQAEQSNKKMSNLIINYSVN